MKTWMALAIGVLLAGCASKRAVPVPCDRHLSPINQPALFAKPETADLVIPEPQAPELPQP